MYEWIKSSLLFTLLQQVYSYFSCHLLAMKLFISTWEKSLENIYHSPPHVCYYSKYPNNDYEIWLLSSSACFKQHFKDWFSVLQYNSDLTKLEWTPLLFNLTKSVIFQIDVNHFPFLMLNMLPFHIRLEHFKVTCNSLIFFF